MTCPVTILLLDDEPLLRCATALILSRRGGRVTVAASAEEAVALACARVHDVAVFDVSGPGPSAAEVLRRIRASAVGPRRVVAVSAGPIADREVEGIGVVLPRPYPFDDLLRAVFGTGGRCRTRSGIFPTLDPGVANAGIVPLVEQARRGSPGSALRAPRRAVRAGRDPGR
jgi:CheY-like chemotaxis protein